MDMVARPTSLFHSHLRLWRGSQVHSTSATRRLVGEGDLLLRGTYCWWWQWHATTLLSKTMRNASRNRNAQNSFYHVHVTSLTSRVGACSRVGMSCGQLARTICVEIAEPVNLAVQRSQSFWLSNGASQFGFPTKPVNSAELLTIARVSRVHYQQ